MPNFDSLFNAFVTLLVTIDPPGLAPIFLAVTSNMNRAQRKQVSVRASVIGFALLALFAVAGSSILSVFGITLAAFASPADSCFSSLPSRWFSRSATTARKRFPTLP